MFLPQRHVSASSCRSSWEPSLLLPSQQMYYGRDLMRTQDPLCHLSDCHIAIDKLIPSLLIFHHFINVKDFAGSILNLAPEIGVEGVEVHVRGGWLTCSV